MASGMQINSKPYSAAKGLKQGLLVQAASVILTLETKEVQGCVSGPEDLEKIKLIAK